MKQIAIIDNYDSFTYNLVHYLEDLGTKVIVMFNDKIDSETLSKADGVVLSPGPGLPKESGDLLKTLAEIKNAKPIFGVCLGMQALCELEGGSLKNLKKVYHGVEGTIQISTDSPIYKGIPGPIAVGRYHSWVVDRVPDCFTVDSKDGEGNAMSMTHKTLPIWAVQYHPESILTPQGKQILANWITTL